MEPEASGKADDGVMIKRLDIFRNQISLKTCPAPAIFTLLPCPPQPNSAYNVFMGLLSLLAPSIAFHIALEGSLNPKW